MAIDMMGLALKGMGFDPAALFAQAELMGKAFARMAATVDRIEAQQLAIMAALGLTVPEPAGEMLTLIEDESRKLLDPTTRARFHDKSAA